MFEKWRKRSADQHVAEPVPVQEQATAVQDEALTQRIIDVLRTIYDPEIPVNIYDLGLIYEISADESGIVHVTMTLTAPGCPVAHTFPGIVEANIKTVEGVNEVTVELVWDPPWSTEYMSESAQVQLGMY